MSKLNTRKEKAMFRVHDVIFMSFGVLLTTTLLSVWLICGMFAKYITTGNDNDSARVAKTGVVKAEILEHEAYNKDKSGIYELRNDEKNTSDSTLHKEVNGNKYTEVLPGVDIPKDPFIRLEIDSEVDYELFLRVTESEYFPEKVTYEIDKVNWKLVSEDTKNHTRIFKYIGNADGVINGYIDAGKHTILIDKILVNNKLEVSQYYDADAEYKKDDNGKFTLSFDAWLKQVD